MPSLDATSRSGRDCQLDALGPAPRGAMQNSFCAALEAELVLRSLQPS